LGRGFASFLLSGRFLVFELFLALAEVFLLRRDIALGLFESGTIGSKLLLGRANVVEFLLDLGFSFGLGFVVSGCALLARSAG